MKEWNFSSKYFLPLLFIVLTGLFTACSETVVDPSDNEPTTDQAALERIVDEDSSLSSFDYTFDEEEPSEFLGKISTEIYPLKVWQRMRLVHRTLDIEIVGDTIAYGLLTKTFEGVLFIKAAFDTLSNEPDTLIQKPFTAVVTRNIIFIRTGRSPFPRHNWRVAAVSLPEGGTQSPNIDITKLTAFLPEGDTLVIESPNDYYFRRGWGGWRDMPHVHPGDSVLLRVEVFSAYEEDDFVTLTFGVNKWIKQRSRKLFELVSSTPNGDGWDKVYEQTFNAHTHPGFFHAVLNAMPRQVIFDDATPVEAESWGVPYVIHLH